MASGVFIPSRLYRGSYLPGPHDADRLLVRESAGDRAYGPDVQISIRPAVLPMTDARHDRVVHGRVAEGAGDAEAHDVIVRIHRGLQTHDGVHLEQRDRRRRALEIDLREDPRRQHVRVHLEPDLERRRRVHALLDDLVQAERVGPELLVAKRVEAEDALALGDEGG
jgi:hypothetical protein